MFRDPADRCARQCALAACAATALLAACETTAPASDGPVVAGVYAVGSPAETHTLTITGSFAADGFTATVHADVTRNGTACSYDVGWIGTRTTR